MTNLFYPYLVENTSFISNIVQIYSVFSSNACVYYNNTAKTYGGVLYSYLGIRMWVTQDLFLKNKAAIGGAIYTKNTITTLPFIIEECAFRLNSAEKFGGAIFSIRAGILMSAFNNTLPLISQNTAGVSGGGLYYCESSVDWYESRMNPVTLRKEKFLINSESSMDAQQMIPKFIAQNSVLTPFHLKDKTSFPAEASLQLIVRGPQSTLEITQKREQIRQIGKQALQRAVIPLASNSSDFNVVAVKTFFGEELEFDLTMKDTFGQMIPYDGTFMRIDTVDDSIVYSEAKSNVFEKDEEGSLPLLHPIVTLVSYSYQDPFPQNATVKFSLTFIQDMLVTYYFNVNFQFDPCPTMHSAFSKTDLNGKKIYYCSFNVAYLLPVILAIGLAVMVAVVVIVVISVRKLKKMKFSVKLLKQKEKAEIELTQKLLDLQTLYASELENRHSFKEWLIKLEDIEIVSKIGEGGQVSDFCCDTYSSYFKNIILKIGLKLEGSCLQG